MTSTKRPQPETAHRYVIRAFDIHDNYVTHAAVVGGLAAKLYRQAVARKHPEVRYFRVVDETADGKAKVIYARRT